MGTECPEEQLKRVIKQRNVTGRADGRRVNKANVKKKNGNSTAVIPREETHCQGGILPKKKRRHPPFLRKRSTGHVLGFFLFFWVFSLRVRCPFKETEEPPVAQGDSPFSAVNH